MKPMTQMKPMMRMFAIAIAGYVVLPIGDAASQPPVPDVNVVNVPGVEVVNEEPIEVMATIGAPVDVTPNPVDRFFEQETTLVDAEATQFFIHFSEVPQGKRLVVEYVSAIFSLELGSATDCSFSRSSSEGNVWVITSEKTSSGRSVYTISTPISFFADAGQHIIFNCSVSDQEGGGSIFAIASITGFFEDVE